MYREKIVNAETGEETFRDYTAEEIFAVEKAKAENEKELAEIELRKKARQEILDRLGLSEEEARLLLG